MIHVGECFAYKFRSLIHFEFIFVYGVRKCSSFIFLLVIVKYVVQHHKWMLNFVKGFGIVNKAEIDVFLELSCFFHDPVDVGNLIFGSSAFFLKPA